MHVCSNAVMYACIQACMTAYVQTGIRIWAGQCAPVNGGIPKPTPNPFMALSASSTVTPLCTRALKSMDREAPVT